MTSTSAFEIDFAATAETVDVPADGAEVPAAAAVDGEGAEVPFAEPADGGGAEESAAAVTLAACLEPKMADTILPKTLILSSCFCSWSQASDPASRHPGRKFRPSERAFTSKRAPCCPLESRWHAQFYPNFHRT